MKIYYGIDFPREEISEIGSQCWSALATTPAETKAEAKEASIIALIFSFFSSSH